MSHTITTNSTTTPDGDTGDVTRRRDLIARIILGLGALGALAATGSMAASVADSDGPLRVAETWQLAGLPVFAGLFLLLAVGPRRTPGLWELVVANKLFLVVAGATFLADTDGGREYVAVDGLLVVLLLAAYVLTRGWAAWRTR